MSKVDIRRIAPLFILPVIVLAMSGIAYAMWSETLRINVTVNTGELDVAWYDYSCSDTGADPQAEGYHNDEEKNVSTCNVDVELYDDEGDAIKLKVIINNAYPGYTVDVTGIVKNVGTIPVKLYSYEFSEYDSTALSVSLDTPSDTQIDPGDTSDYTLHITVLQDAEENHTYTLELTLTFAQWNEVTD